MAPRNKILQSLYLEPEQSKLLDEVAAETRIPKAVLLREAVDELLSLHHKIPITPRHMKVHAALKMARAQLNQYRKSLPRDQEGVAALQACDRAIDRIEEARTAINC